MFGQSAAFPHVARAVPYGLVCDGCNTLPASLYPYFDIPIIYVVSPMYVMYTITFFRAIHSVGKLYCGHNLDNVV